MCCLNITRSVSKLFWCW